MYIPKLFKVESSDEIRAFIRENGFGILINQGSTQLQATHIPLLLQTTKNGAEVLSGHLSRANPQGQSFENNSDVLVIFQGAHAYISSSWYDHNNVPTWNYLAVHVYGTIRIQRADELLDSLKALTDKYEADSAQPVAVETMDEAMLSAQLKGIVGFEIKINEIHAAYKLSQNRDDKNHRRIVDELERKGDENALRIANAMRKNRS